MACGESLPPTQSFLQSSAAAAALGISKQGLHRRIRAGKCLPAPIGKTSTGALLWDKAQIERAAELISQKPESSK